VRGRDIATDTCAATFRGKPRRSPDSDDVGLAAHHYVVDPARCALTYSGAAANRQHLDTGDRFRGQVGHTAETRCATSIDEDDRISGLVAIFSRDFLDKLADAIDPKGRQILRRKSPFGWYAWRKTPALDDDFARLVRRLGKNSLRRNKQQCCR